MKRFLPLFFFCIASVVSLRAQTFGNEWIDYSLKHYKIKVVQTGIYRISYNTLASAGIPVNSIDPRRFQVFNNGQEQKIFIQGEGDALFDSNDYIEFYAEKNTGANELPLYHNAAFVPNPYYSLINDTAVYFLTWNNSVNNKRMALETDVNFGSYTPIDYFFKEQIQAYNSAYYGGETDRAGGTNARYVISEGYFDNQVFNLGANVQKNINLSNIYTSGPAAKFESVVVGASQDFNLLVQNKPDHHLRIEIKPSTSGTFNLLKDTLFKGYAANKFVANISTSLLGATTNLRYSSISDAGFVSNRTAISYINIKYPHTLAMENASSFTMYIPDNVSQVKSYLSMTSLNASDSVCLYNITNGTRIKVVKTGSNFNALIENTGMEKKCFIASEAAMLNVTNIQPVTPSGLFTNYALFSADSAYIIVYPKKLNSSALDYKNYRAFNIYGGQHNVIMADIDELYDQFAYGIVKSPLSIKGFSNFLINTYPTPPNNLLLLGKSLSPTLCRTNTTNYANCLVPSFGNPACDGLFTVGLNGSTYESGIATGRIAAKSDAQVLLYLNKVKDYENLLNNPPAEWKKRALHFGGGKTNIEQRSFKVYLNRYKDTLEGVYFGGKVNSYFKTTSAPIQINTSDEIRQRIDEGVSLMTFFGHASGLGFDQSIDDINSYNPRPGHYPLMLANGCFGGDIHSTLLSSSESFVLTENKGVIGYLGTIGLGIPYALNAYTTEWYAQLARKSYGKSIGKVIQQTVKVLAPVASGDAVIGATCYEMTLHGDPAIIINSYEKPDYKITYSDVYYDTETYPDSIIVNVIRTNIGRATNDIIFTELRRTLPTGAIETYLSRSIAPKFKDTIAFSIPVNPLTGRGVNKIKVTLDALNEINELNENNNTTGDIDLLIEGRGIIPIYPYEFSIIPTDTITLKGSTVNPFEKNANYIFQIDTADGFNSPFMRSSTISASGGVVSWKPPITFSDSTVYYWRVTPDSTSSSNGYLWKESSFQYINGKSGWGQAHFFQFKDDGYEYVKLNRFNRRFDFINSIQSIQCNTRLANPLGEDWKLVTWSYNGDKTYKEWHCNQGNPSITVVVIDPLNGKNLFSPVIGNLASSSNNGLYGNCHCRNYPYTNFDFLVSTPAQRNFLLNFLNNNTAIPNGHYVLAYNMTNVNFPLFAEPLKQAFENIGSTQIRNLTSNIPFIIWGRKGDPIGSATEVVGTSSSSIIDLNTTFSTNWKEGSISSPVIGPASSWGSFHWRQRTADGITTKDEVSVKLIGIKTDGTETDLVTFPKDSIDILNLSNYVNASVYPSIRLVALMKDTALFTPAQMRRWQVIYDPVPEGALNPPLGFYLSNDTLEEGESAEIHIPFQNVSNVAFNDSLLFTYWSENINGEIVPLPDKIKRNMLLPNEYVKDTLKVNTLNYPGIKNLWVEVNPIGRSQSQPEQYHFNNITRIPLVINSDNTNPLLDVTFDGVHILNNDIVSAKPNILISLKDENRYLELNDTSDFRVYLLEPSATIAKPIYFGNEMSFTPAVLPNNSAKINYTPTLRQDGTYQLLVQAQDRSSNESGQVDYRINFKVINKSTITEVMNYPNPFSTATRFVFTLTGSVIPTYFKIQILNISGKVVKEITQDELGFMHIGRNITEYAWDGKDEFGDQLANGVYLYRVVTSINGQSIEKQSTEADQYFKKEFGKMYLMR
jgi:hypothetical protein